MAKDDEELKDTEGQSKKNLILTIIAFIVISVLFWVVFIRDKSEDDAQKQPVVTQGPDITEEPEPIPEDETLESFIADIKDDINIIMLREYINKDDVTDSETWKMFKPVRDRMGKQDTINIVTGVREGTLSSDGETKVIFDVSMYDKNGFKLKYVYAFNYGVMTGRKGNVDYYAMSSTLTFEE